MRKSVIRTVDLTKKFGDFTANDRICLDVAEKEIKCIVGENGAGKSTLMNMLYGLLQPTSGEIYVRDKKIVLSGPLDAIKQGIGMVHQHFKLVPSLTVYENIMLGTEIKKGSSPFINRKAEQEAVQRLIAENHLSLNAKDKVEDISVGERQRVEILKMLYRNVDILILDEPTAVLTPQEVDDLIATLKTLRDHGKTIIVITHKLREVMELADTITVIKSGRIVGDVKKEDTDETSLAQMMVGRDVVLTVKNDRSRSVTDHIVYRADGISTRNDYGKEVVSNLSFSVKKGEILGIAGVEGNGQSELVKVMTGLMRTSAGKIFFEDREITDFWPDKLRTLGIGIIPEDRYAQGLCRTMTVSQNCIAGYHKGERYTRCGLLKRKKIRESRDQFIEEYDIRLGDAEGTCGTMSGGNAQKVIIARELSANPKLLIACQPTRGVDIGSIEFIHKQILKFRDAGNTVILISSELSEIFSLSDRMIVMYKGRISGEVCPKEVSMAAVGLLMAGINR